MNGDPLRKTEGNDSYVVEREVREIAQEEIAGRLSSVNYDEVVWPLLERDDGKKRIARLGFQGTALWAKVALGVFLTLTGISSALIWNRVSSTLTALTTLNRDVDGLQKRIEQANELQVRLATEISGLDTRMSNLKLDISAAEKRVSGMQDAVLNQARLEILGSVTELSATAQRRIDERLGNIERNAAEAHAFLSSDTRQALQQIMADSAEMQSSITSSRLQTDRLEATLAATTQALGETSVQFIEARKPIWLERENISLEVDKLPRYSNLAQGLSITDQRGNVIAKIGQLPFDHRYDLSHDGMCIAITLAKPMGVRARSILVAHSFGVDLGARCTSQQPDAKLAATTD